MLFPLEKLSRPALHQTADRHSYRLAGDHVIEDLAAKEPDNVPLVDGEQNRARIDWILGLNLLGGQKHKR